jgi:hypothetical protein
MEERRIAKAMKCRCNKCEAKRQRERRKTPQWREWRRLYLKSERGQETTRRYKTGLVGKLADKRYKKGEAYAASRRRCQNKRRKNDITVRIRHSLSSRITAVLRRQRTNKNNRTIDLLGCSIRDFKMYLETRFKPGMTWENYGSKWHIDHIVPCAMFDLSDREQQNYCFHFSNMRPMWAEENMRRGHRGHHQLTFRIESGGIPR